jgi:hypothetical protein
MKTRAAYISAIVMFSIIVGLVVFSKAALANPAEQEYVVNGEFETGSLTPWINEGGSDASVTDTMSHSNAYCLETGGFTYKIVTQEFDPAAETIARLIFWIYVPADLNPPGYIPGPGVTPPNPSFSVTIGYQESPGSQSFPVSLAAYTPGWNKIVIPFNEAVHVTDIGFSTGEIAILYIDDVSLPGLTYDFESCDSSSATKNTFNTGEYIYVKGSGWPGMPPSAYRGFELYVVEDTNWIDGIPIPSPAVRYLRDSGIRDSMQFAPDYLGNFIVPVAPGSREVSADTFEPDYLAPGGYDIIVDVNNNGVYDEGIDVVDDMDIGNAGVFVVPEVPLGALSAFTAMTIALSLAKRRTIKPHI